MFFKVCNADAEVVELVSELCGELVNRCLVGGADILLRHCLCHHLRHLVARDVLVATERCIAVAFDDAVSGKLLASIESPVVGRNVAERVRRGKRRGSGPDEHGKRECGSDGFLEHR